MAELSSKTSYSNFIPSAELTITDQKDLKTKAIQVGMAHALAKNLATTPEALTVRAIRPSIDFPVAFAAGDRWIFPAPAAAVAAAFTVTNWINERLPNNTVVVIYGAGFESAAPEVSEIFFRSGPGGGGRTAAVFNVEDCYTKMESDGFFGLPIVYDPLELVFIQVTNRIPIAVAGTILILKGYAVEPRTEQIS